MIGALILAGRPNTGALRGLGPEESEALVDVSGLPMIARIVAAAEGCPELDPITVVGPARALGPALSGSRAIVVDGAGGLVENIRRGLAAMYGVSWILIMTSDIPLINTKTLQDVLQHCDRSSAQLFYPIVRKEVYERRFPGSRRTYARLVEGTFTGGNVFLIHAAALEPVLTVVERLYAIRKSPLRLAQFLGLGFVVRLLFGRLSIRELERFISEKLGIVGKAIITEAAEIGFDVDRPDDLHLALQFLPDAGVRHGSPSA